MLISFLYEAFFVMFGRKLLHIQRLFELNLTGICSFRDVVIFIHDASNFLRLTHVRK